MLSDPLAGCRTFEALLLSASSHMHEQMLED